MAYRRVITGTLPAECLVPADQPILLENKSGVHLAILPPGEHNIAGDNYWVQVIYTDGLVEVNLANAGGYLGMLKHDEWELPECVEPGPIKIVNSAETILLYRAPITLPANVYRRLRILTDVNREQEILVYSGERGGQMAFFAEIIAWPFIDRDPDYDDTELRPGILVVPDGGRQFRPLSDVYAVKLLYATGNVAVNLGNDFEPLLVDETLRFERPDNWPKEVTTCSPEFYLAEESIFLLSRKRSLPPDIDDNDKPF